MNLTGWIIYNGHLPGQKFQDYAEWLKQAAAARHMKTTIIKNNDLLAYLSDTGPSLIKLAEEKRPDFVIFGDKDIFLAQQLEMMGIPVYNSSKAIELSDNKISTYQQLAEHRLPIPETVIAPKIFPGVQQIDMDGLIKAGERLGYPLVVKEAYGSFGEQVYLVKSVEELAAKANQLKEKPYLLQTFISTSYGKDVRLNVVGDKVVAAMKRTAKNDFRANVTAGGKMEVYEPSPEEETIAVKATRAVGADFAGIDLLFGPNGPIVCEINSNAHIRNIYDCTGINVADFMIDYIIKQLTE